MFSTGEKGGKRVNRKAEAAVKIIVKAKSIK